MTNIKVGNALSFKVRIGPKQGPTNVSPIEQRLYKMGYRMFQEKTDDKMRYRSYYRNGKCIRVGDILNHSKNVPKNATM